MKLLPMLLLLGCTSGARCEPIVFSPQDESGSSESIALRGCFLRANEAIGAVVLAHGLGGESDDWTTFAATLHEAGISSLRFDLRGHGGSGGTFPTQDPSQYGIAAGDVRGALHWLRSQPGMDSTRIVLVGLSLGGGAVIANALDTPGMPFVAWYPGLTYLAGGDSLVTIGSSHTEGLIVHGTQDSNPRANPSWTRRFAAINPGVRVEWITGGGHGVGADRAAYESSTLEAITAWLKQ